ncbi:winged helix-turn-helix domain-containing protein [Solwaraspora sp. WMMD791]|uniref:winged helix-turn-helix domain-containing protein n=1 Tax=Solwaraspora sp. WMMD791 TaxID=3016086 RepID=UPI00249ABB21|nr:winged helix-turn-helix domain-containing protein [Solwaraspora sp. WMMD791]WFE28911.1 winged helix-turn-helix domain-containing protein [Solwaraspora sp. WMMD791]
MDEQLSTVWLTGDQVRSLAHPLRLRLLGALRLDGPATATSLAHELGTNTGATSYHLRKLADAGLVREEPARGTGRERWWRAVHQNTSWRNTSFDDDPDARAAADWLNSYFLQVFVQRAEDWHAARDGYSAQWRDAADYSDTRLTLTADQLRRLNAEIAEVVERYRTDPGPGDGAAEQVLLYRYAFPRVVKGGGADRDGFGGDEPVGDQR